MLTVTYSIGTCGDLTVIQWCGAWKWKLFYLSRKASRQPLTSTPQELLFSPVFSLSSLLVKFELFPPGPCPRAFFPRLLPPSSSLSCSIFSCTSPFLDFLCQFCFEDDGLPPQLWIGRRYGDWCWSAVGRASFPAEGSDVKLAHV